jgi:hypothetical protein
MVLKEKVSNENSNGKKAKMGVIIGGSADSIHILKNILSIFYKYTTEKRASNPDYHLPLSVIAGIHYVEGIMFGADYLQGLYVGEDPMKPVLEISAFEGKSRAGNAGVYIARAAHDTEISPINGIPLLKDQRTIYSINLDLLIKSGAHYFNTHGMPYCPVMMRGTMSDGVIGFSEAMAGEMAIAGIIEDPAKIKQHAFGEMPRNTLKRVQNKMSSEDFNRRIIITRGEVIGDILLYQLERVLELENG